MTLEKRLPSQSPGFDKESYNRLIHEKSPYLLQHAHNPVNWYPWGDEAFTRATREDKPLFLSIGYATCHWCHVMAHESFEDMKVAALLNKDFICIKVDREERPDIDSVYMSVCQMLTGQGGWPLTIILTPGKKPFFAGTYIPKESRFGMTGLTDLLPHITQSWQERRKDLVTTADEISAALHREHEPFRGDIPEISLLNEAYEELVLRFDAEYGGFGRAPKFPTPHTLLFLLRFWKRTGNKRALAMVEKTLREMSLGGIFDQVGGGFHRYSTDAKWRVPHFEKMLYDQALLIMAYTEGYQATHSREFRKTAEEVITYTIRDLISPCGAFYSAEDADSAGGEGLFYLWTVREMEDVLGKDDAIHAIRIFNVTQSGNYHDTGNGMGRNILYRTRSLAGLSSADGIPETDLELRLESIRTELFAARSQRSRPPLDDKILTDWNGLFIAALAKAARAFSNEDFLTAARKAMEFILIHMRDSNGGLLHRYREGEAAIPAFGDDYAFIIKGLIELYESTFEPYYLQTAIELNTLFLAHFLDEGRGGFFSTSDDAEILLVRKKEVYDGAIPSCNSVAFENLVRLSHLTGDIRIEERAEELSRYFAPVVQQSPSAFAWYLCALDSAMGPIHDIVIVGKRDADDTRAMIEALDNHYLPNILVLYLPPGQSENLLNNIAPFTRSLNEIDGKATAYICTGHSCAIPTTDPKRMLELLGPVNSEK
jgi:uncharacterized protein YyaL (SSP411 family)